jgi:hypothetical protein
VQCLQYSTDQAQDLKRLEKLTQLFFALTVYGESAELGTHASAAAAAAAALSLAPSPPWAALSPSSPFAPDLPARRGVREALARAARGSSLAGLLLRRRRLGWACHALGDPRFPTPRSSHRR